MNFYQHVLTQVILVMAAGRDLKKKRFISIFTHAKLCNITIPKRGLVVKFFFFSAATVFCKSLKNVRYQFIIEVQKEVPFLLEKLKDLYPFSIF